MKSWKDFDVASRHMIVIIPSFVIFMFANAGIYQSLHSKYFDAISYNYILSMNEYPISSVKRLYLSINYQIHAQVPPNIMTLFHTTHPLATCKQFHLRLVMATLHHNVMQEG